MKIVLNTVFLTSENFGGSWTYSYNLVKYLPFTEAGHEIIVIVNDRVRDRFEGLNVRLYPVKVNSNTRFERVFWEQIHLPRILKELSPDIFHTTGNILPFVSYTPSVLTIHDFQYKHFPNNFTAVKRNFLRLTIPYSVRTATRLICVSQFTRQEAQRLFGVSQDRSVVIYEAGLAEDEYDTATPEKELRQKYNLPNPFILYAGSSFPHKNVERLIEAFRLIHQRTENDLLIVGESFGKNDFYREKVYSLFGSDAIRVKRTGFIPRNDLIGLYKIAKCYVFPSLFEGFGIPIIEAMQCGCPVVASNVTAIPEIGGEAVLYVNPYESTSIADGILEMVCNEELRSKYINAGYKQSGKFSWETMALETVKEYKKILSA